MELCPGDMVDFTMVEDAVAAAVDVFDLDTLGVDPYLSRTLTPRLMERRVNVVEIPQDMKNLSPAMKEVERLTRAHQMLHEHNTAARWCFGNVRCAVDGNENNVRPNEAMTPSIRKEVLENSRNEGGNAYDWIIRSPRTGRVTELIPVPWYLVEPWKNEAGQIWYTVTHPLTGEPMVLPQEDICHYKGATRDGLKGISVLRRASDTLASARAAQEYERAYYESGGQPAGVLKTDTDLGGYVKGPDGQIQRRTDGSPISMKDALRSEWEKIHAGPRNGHRVAILDLGLDYKPIASSNQEAQFVESKEVSVRDIARYFGVPLYKLGEGKEAYSSNEQNAIEYVVGTLHPIVTQYEEEQTWKLLTDREIAAGLEVRINLMAELRGDSAARMHIYQTMLQEGPYSVNEVRALEDLPDTEGGDEHRASLNYVPLRLWPELSLKRAESRPPAE